MFIRYTGNNATVAYAAEELEKYLHRMMPNLDICIVNTGAMMQKDSILLGTLKELGLPDAEVKDDFLDDLVDIRIDKLTGVIAGSNARSILIGVYRFLRLAGCRWMHPGDSGEIIPEKDISSEAYTYRKLADHRFRGQAIEGAVSYTHVRDTIWYLPKVGMNLFMLEQIVPYNYIARWYLHQSNTRRSAEDTTFEEVAEMVHMLELETKRCGVQLHAMGHGYLFEPFGIHYRTKDDAYTLTEEARQACALVNGVRGLYGHSPNYTQLCFSDGQIRKKLVDFCVQYAKDKPYIDFLHVWLSDAANNHCECEACRKKTVSDWYTILLNEIDEAFTANGIDMRIVFILYNDTLWAPTETVLKNPKRFTLLSTLNRRYFADGPVDPRRVDVMPPYVRNNYHGEWPLDMKLKGLDEWREHFDGPGFLYEYYFYTAQYNDPGSVRFAQVIWEDVQRNHSLGFDGVISDQTQRFGFPNAFAHYVLAEALFDKTLSYDEIRKEIFDGVYGEDADAVYAYLQALSEAFMPQLLSRSDKGVVEEDTGTGGVVQIEAPVWQYNPELAASLEKVPQLTAGISPLLKAHAGEMAWEELADHAEFAEELARVLKEGACGRPEAMKKEAGALLDRLSEREEKQHTSFDLYLFAQWMCNKMN